MIPLEEDGMLFYIVLIETMIKKRLVFGVPHLLIFVRVARRLWKF